MTLPTGSLISKDPQAMNVPKGIDWTAYLADIGATELIITSTWTIAGPDSALTVSSPSIVLGSKQTQARLSGGTPGAQYRVANAIVTSSNITDERSFTVLVENL